MLAGKEVFSPSDSIYSRVYYKFNWWFYFFLRLENKDKEIKKLKEDFKKQKDAIEEAKTASEK